MKSSVIIWQMVSAAVVRHGLGTWEPTTNSRPESSLGGVPTFGPHYAALDPISHPAQYPTSFPNDPIDTVTGPMLQHNWDFCIRVRVKQTWVILFFGSIAFGYASFIFSWLPFSPVPKTKEWEQKEMAMAARAWGEPSLLYAFHWKWGWKGIRLDSLTPLMIL